jgi:hypothetical protein
MCFWNGSAFVIPTGALTVASQDTVIGSHSRVNFQTGPGLLSLISDTGSEIDILWALDTAVNQTQQGEQSGSALLCASASGSNTNYQCSLTPTLGAYTAGMTLHWKPDVNGAGGTTTLNVDTLGAMPIKLHDGASAPAATDIVAGQLYDIWYDGAQFRLMTAIPSQASGPVTSVFGRQGTIAAQAGDYTTDQITEGTAKFFTTARAQTALAGMYQTPISGAPGTWPSFGAAALLGVGTTTGTVAAGNDSRFGVATAVNGTAVGASSAADQVLTTTSSGSAAWETAANCTSSGGVTQYSTTSHTLTCHTLSNSDLPTTMSGIAIDGVTPTVMGYVDPTSSIQTQLNGKAPTLTAHTTSAVLVCADTSSSATTYACATTPSFTPAAGDVVLFTAINQANSGTSTLNVNSSGAKTIKKQQNAANLASGDLAAAGAVLMEYDGTYWQVQGQTANAAAGGTSVNVNGSSVSSPNFNGSTPAAQSGYTDVTFQVSGSSVSAEIPATATPTASSIPVAGANSQLAVGWIPQTVTWVLCAAASCSTSDAILIPFRVQAAGSSNTCYIAASTPPTGADLIVQVMKNGSNAFTVDLAAGTAANTFLTSTPGMTRAAGDVLKASITQVGSTVPGQYVMLTCTLQ